MGNSKLTNVIQYIVHVAASPESSKISLYRVHTSLYVICCHTGLMESRDPHDLVVLHGSCACGRISYTSTTAPDGATNCHCTECRKIAGAPYLSFAAFARSSLTWSRQPDLWCSSSIAERGFCSTCGSALTMQYYLQPERISITYGSIDDCTEELRPPTQHIFLAEKASWFTVPDDGLERYEKFDPPYQEKIDRWKKENGK